MEYKYLIENDAILFIRGGSKEPKEYDNISIMYDSDDNVLLKHGSSELVQNYFNNFVSKLTKGKNQQNKDFVDEMIESSRIITISKDTILNKPEILKDINKSISTSGYISKFMEKYEM